MLSRSDLRAKLSSSQLEESLRTEIAAMQSLDHRNIVRLHEALEDEKSKKIFLVMEYCSRGALLSSDYWKAYKHSENNLLGEETNDVLKSKRLPLARAKRYLRDVARGLDYLHNVRSIVHHDIKPENILVDSCDVAKISDFGVAEILAHGSDKSFDHQRGTKLFLPPEAWSRTLLLTQAPTCTANQLTCGLSAARSTR